MLDKHTYGLQNSPGKVEGLLQEMEEIYHLTGLDYWHPRNFPLSTREAELNDVKVQVIRGWVIHRHTFVDVLLGLQLARRDVPDKTKWKTKEFRRYRERLMKQGFLKKLAKVYKNEDVPDEVRRTIKALNDLRDSFAHRYLPGEEFRHKYHYKGSDIRELETARLFSAEMTEVAEFFMEMAVRTPRLADRRTGTAELPPDRGPC